MRKAAFRNLGCKVNEYEMEYMQQKMSDFGFEVVPFDEKADVYVVNTCTVTNIADRKSRQMLHKAKKQNPDAVVVAIGCYVQTDMEGASKDKAVDILIGNDKKSLLPEIVTEYLKNKEGGEAADKYTAVSDLSALTKYEDMLVNKTAEHERAYVKIEDGCNQFCSYCAIPLARGRVRSRSIESIAREAEALAKNGYKELVLTGIHLSSYGLDFHIKENGMSLNYNEAAGEGGYTNEELLRVINKIQKTDGIKRIRLSSLEPRVITEEFLTELVKNDKICPHFHLSLQSGCDDTLKRMNRKYTTDEYRKGVELIRKYYEHPAITTDIIAGFPGETDEEFDKTMDFIKNTEFYEMHIFKYSKRKNTVAAAMPMQVSDEVKNKRSAALIALSDELSKKFRSYYTGKEVSVLFEEKKNGFYLGHTPEYVKVAKRSSENLKGQIITGRIARESNGLLYFE